MKKVRLGDVCDVRDGTHNSPKYIERGFPLVTSKNIKGGKIDLADVNYISQADYDEINKRSKVNKGDILLPMIGTIGNPIIINEEPTFAIKNVCLLKQSEKVLSSYLFYILLSDLSVRNLFNKSKGGTQKFISLGDIRNFQIPLPSLAEQKAIAAKLDKAQEVIRYTEEIIANYDTLTQSLFLDMFGDPVKNEKGWEKGVIRDLCEEVKYGTSAKADEVGQYPYLRMNNITYEGYMSYTNLKYINVSLNDFEKYSVTKGDILFNRTNSKELVGKTGLIRDERVYIIAGYLIRVRVNSLANSYYLWAFLNSKWTKSTLQNMCKNIVGMANINAQELQNISIQIPPIALQNQFAERVVAIEAQKQQAQESLAKSQDLFNSLLQESFKN